MKALLLTLTLVLTSCSNTPESTIDTAKASNCQLRCEKQGAQFSFDYNANRCTCTAN